MVSQEDKAKIDDANHGHVNADRVPMILGIPLSVVIGSIPN
jgi:hypothetical protein